jgi:tetratricopeptide (TPR) repeat protein
MPVSLSPVLKRLPYAALVVVAAMIAALVVITAHGRSAQRPSAASAAPALQVTSAPLAGLTTRQLVDRYTAVVKVSPRSPMAYDNLALAELQLAREDADPTWYGKAELLFKKALALNSNDFEALGGLGSLAASRHDFTTALAMGRGALSIDAESGYALGVVVDAEVELGRYPAARRTLQRMLNDRPDLSSFSRASYLLELEGHIPAARRALVQAIESGAPAKENTAWAYLYLGNLEFSQGDYAQAGGQYRLAGEAQPGFVHALAAEAKLAAARGDYPRAIRIYRQVTARLPLPAYVIALCDVQAAAGRTAAAARTEGLVRAEEALYAANGVNVDVELALFEADHGGDPQQALARAQEAERVQKSVVVEDALGWTLFRAGHPHQALAALDRALALGSRDSSFLYHRGAIEAALGLRAQARHDLATALAINPHFSVLYEPDARRLLKEVTR